MCNSLDLRLHPAPRGQLFIAKLLPQFPTAIDILFQNLVSSFMKYTHMLRYNNYYCYVLDSAN